MNPMNQLLLLYYAAVRRLVARKICSTSFNNQLLFILRETLADPRLVGAYSLLFYFSLAQAPESVLISAGESSRKLSVALWYTVENCHQGSRTILMFSLCTREFVGSHFPEVSLITRTNLNIVTRQISLQVKLFESFLHTSPGDDFHVHYSNPLGQHQECSFCSYRWIELGNGILNMVPSSGKVQDKRLNTTTSLRSSK